MSASAYVVIEGVDGAGKTLQARSLVARLEGAGIGSVYLTEPSKKPGTIGAYIRQRILEGPPLDPWEGIGLFVADRRQQLESELRPALATGRVVVQDRSWISTAVYQGDWDEVARNKEPKWPSGEFIAHAHKAFMPPPDLLVLIDVPTAVAQARVKARVSGQKLDQFDATGALELDQRRGRYLRLVNAHLAIDGWWGKAVVIDGARAAESVSADIWAHVEEILASKSTQADEKKASSS